MKASQKRPASAAILVTREREIPPTRIDEGKTERQPGQHEERGRLPLYAGLSGRRNRLSNGGRSRIR